MTEFDIMAKDYIKLGFLNEVVNQNSVSFSVFLESEGVEKNFTQIRTDKNVYRFNNFNVSEDTTQNTITFRPIVVGCYSYFKVITSIPLTLDIIKNGTTTIARQFTLHAGENKIEFDPQGIQKYVMKIEESVSEGAQNNVIAANPVQEQKPVEMPANPFDNPFGGAVDFGGVSSAPIQRNEQETERKRDQLVQSNSRLENDISDLQAKINALEAKNEQLVVNKKNLTAHLKRLQEEYEKDYSAYEADIEEIKCRFTIDQELLKMYADKEVTPIEELISRSEKDIQEIEEQARIFIEAQQRRTAEIEGEFKIGKKE